MSERRRNGASNSVSTATRVNAAPHLPQKISRAVSRVSTSDSQVCFSYSDESKLYAISGAARHIVNRENHKATSIPGR
jgi:hypothetical protein